MPKPKKVRKLSLKSQCQLNDEMRHVAVLYFDLTPAQRRSGSFDRLIVDEKCKVQIASWNTNYHHGAIEDYEVRDMKLGEAKGWIPMLEQAFRENAWERYKRKLQDQALADFYDRNLIPREKNDNDDRNLKGE